MNPDDQWSKNLRMVAEGVRSQVREPRDSFDVMRLGKEIEDFDAFGVIARCSEQCRVTRQRNWITADEDDRCRCCSDERIHSRLAEPRSRRVRNDHVVTESFQASDLFIRREFIQGLLAMEIGVA